MTPTRPWEVLYLVKVADDTFSVEDYAGEVSLVNGDTLRKLLKQLSKGTVCGSEVEGEALG